MRMTFPQVQPKAAVRMTATYINGSTVANIDTSVHTILTFTLEQDGQAGEVRIALGNLWSMVKRAHRAKTRKSQDGPITVKALGISQKSIDNLNANQVTSTSSPDGR